MAIPNLLIAVVDDESSVRTMLRRALRIADYQTVTFARGEEFLASLAKCLPACAIIDVNMPGLSGFDVAQRMRAANVAVPLVFVTGSDDATLDRVAAGGGAVCLLRKPFSTDRLLDAVRDAVREAAD